MDLMSGEREGDELRRVGRRALYEGTRDHKESLTQYVARRDLQFQEAEGNDLWLSEKLKGLMLEEGAGLSAQGQQNMRTLTQGSLDYKQ
eukprot:586031-Pyramimonas_sp.AAC.1